VASRLFDSVRLMDGLASGLFQRHAPDPQFCSRAATHTVTAMAVRVGRRASDWHLVGGSVRLKRNQT
jgi:hypothetical protein